MIALALALLGCTTAPPPLDPTPIAPASAPCAPLAQGSGTLDLVVVRGDGISDATLDRAVGLLAGRLALQGIGVGSVAGPVPLGARHALGRRPDAPGPALGPVAELTSADATVHLVVVQGVIDPGSTLARHVALAGVGLHPTAPASPEVQQLQATLPDGAPPLLVVGAPALRDPTAGGALLLHELGHALGLPHADDSILRTGPEGPCLRGLSREELATVGWSQ